MKFQPRFPLRVALLLAVLSHAWATPPATPRNLLSGAPEKHELGRDVPAVQAALLPPGQWHPFPRAAERAAWTGLPADLRQGILAAGEAALVGPWASLRATGYLAYVRTGDRVANQGPRIERRQRLIKLVLAECVEGQGRFLDEIADGIWATCEETYWGYSAHVFMQRAGSGLPDVTEPTVDLGVGETGAMLAWTSYLLGPQLDDVSPLLRKRIRYECERRLLAPCFDRADFWWMSWDDQGHGINNWNPWIVSNWLSTALLLEEDPERRARHVEKGQRVLDNYLNTLPDDGGCDEGPGYWGRAGASLFDALSWMDSASAGRISIFDHPLIRNVGRYIMLAHINRDWFINFADARARNRTDGALIYRFGQAVHDPELAAFGAWVWQNGPAFEPGFDRSLGRVLPQLFVTAELNRQPADAPLPRDGWLPDLQVMIARDAGGTNRGLTLVAKGGHNAENHNHNDVGSYLAYLDGEPLIIDAGPEAYTGRTFSAERYQIWTMRSGWHNVPLINGAEQAPGREHAARDLHYASDDQAARFGLELADAYPAAAGITSWRRDYALVRGQSLRIHDTYTINQPSAPTELHHLTHRAVTVLRPGVLRLGPAPSAPTGRGAELSYDPKQLTVEIESREVTDATLRGIWGPEVHLIKLIEKSPAATGAHTIELRPIDAP